MAEHGRERQAADLRDTACHNAVKPCAGIGACHQVFAEVMRLVDTDGFAHSFDFARGGLKGVGAAEAWRLVARLIASCEVVDHLKAELLAPNRAHFVKDVIHGRLAEGARGGEFFVWIADRKALLVVFDDFGQGVARGDPVPKARHIHRHGVTLALALDHPLREHEAHAAAL